MNNFLKPWPTRLTHRIQGTFGRIIFIPTVFGAIFLDSLMTGTARAALKFGALFRLHTAALPQARWSTSWA